MWVPMTINTLRTTANKGLFSFRTMATFTRNLIMYTFNSKSPEIMILSHIDRPTVRRMAAHTIGALLTCMYIDMTIFADRRCTPVLIFDVAFAAFCLEMLAFQRVVCLSTMIKVHHRCPSVRGMTCLAGSIELPLMKIVMAIGARRINGDIMSVFMAGTTLHQFVSTL